MNDETTEAAASDEGRRALLDGYERRRRAVFQRALALDGKALAELMPAQRGELEAAKALLDGYDPLTREELEVAEGTLDAYEKEVDSALSVIADVAEKRAAVALPPQRRRRHIVVAAAGLGIVVVGLVAWGWYADHAPVTEATTPATAAPPPTATPTPKAAPAAPARQPAPVYQPAPAAATTTVPKVPPRGPRLRPVPLPEGRVAALWTHKDKGRAALDVTHFVDAGGREVGERPGIHLIVGDKLYRWESGERTKAGKELPPGPTEQVLGPDPARRGAGAGGHRPAHPDWGLSAGRQGPGGARLERLFAARHPGERDLRPRGGRLRRLRRQPPRRRGRGQGRGGARRWHHRRHPHGRSARRRGLAPRRRREEARRSGEGVRPRTRRVPRPGHRRRSAFRCSTPAARAGCSSTPSPPPGGRATNSGRTTPCPSAWSSPACPNG